MPLTPAYAWTETESRVQITIDGVPIKDQSQLFCSDRLVKLNAPPYLLLLDLKEHVDDDLSTATVLHGRKVVFQLAKARPGLWGSLTADGDKCTIKQQREESVQRAHEKQVAAQQQRLARKQQEEKSAIDRQIAHERAQRARVEQLKEQELQQERRQLQQWQQQQAGSGDESDYEDDLAVDEALAEGAVTYGLQESSLQDGSLQEEMPDHPDYHGRGWKPNNATSAEAGNVVKQLGQQQQQTGSKDNSSSSSSSGGGGEAGADAPGMVMLTAGGSSNQASSAITALLSDAAAAATGHAYAANVDGSGNSSTCGICSTDSSSAAASGSSDRLLTVRSSSSSSSSTAISPAAAPVPAVLSKPKPAKPAPPAKPLAPVRSRAAPVAVSFTQLSTPHLPAREQREVELKDIKRHAKADSLDVSERQPAFLKDKGDALAAQGNYRGAINAYTRALELQPKQPSLWSNRAACHLALGQAAECLQDCSAAVELLQAAHTQLLQTAGQPGAEQELLAGLLPAAGAAAAAAGAAEQQQPAAQGDLEAAAAAAPGVDASRQQQQPAAHEAAAEKPSDNNSSSSSGGAAVKLQRQLAKVLARRAAAHVELQQLQEAWEDLQQALRYDPGNAQLQADALELSAALNPDTGTTPASLKERADARFKAGDLEGAAEAYTAVVQLLQTQLQQQQQQQQADVAAEAAQEQQQHAAQLLAALSNRAACLLSLEQYNNCVEDCHVALALALAEPQATHDAAEAAAAASADAASSTAAVALLDADPTAADGDEQQSTVAKLRVLRLLQQQSPERLLAMPSAGPARVRSIARLLSRLAVAQGCLKDVHHAVQLYGHALQWWRAVGEEQRAAEMAADQQRLQQLLPATQPA